MHRLSLALLLPALGVTAGVRAQDASADEDYGFGAMAEVAAPIAETDEDDTAASTVVSARDTSRADLTLQELLFEVPGAHVVQSGGQGSYSTVSLRGGELGHTSFLLGEMPVSGPDSGPLDLSLLPIEAFDRLEVYRGGAPALFDSGAIGGVVRLVPREDRQDRLFATATGGSFGSWRADVTSVLRRGRFFVATNAGADGSRGDFPYRYDNATVFDPTDDEIRRRANAETLGAHGMLHVRGTVGSHGRVSALLLGVSRQGGMPGLGASPAYDARREDLRALGALEYQHCGEHGRLQLVVGGSFRRQRFTDLLGEIGIGRDATNDTSRHFFSRVAGVAQPTAWLELTSVLSVRRDGYDPENRLARDESRSARTTISGTQEVRLHGDLRGVGFELRPSVRVEHARTDAYGMRLGQEHLFDSTITRPTFRVGASVRPLPWLGIVGSLANGTRMPSVLELFGDRGALLPNAELTPERGRSADGGVLVRLVRERGELVAEARYFHLSVDDLIRYQATSQYTAIAQNVARGEVNGVEAGSRFSIGAHVRGQVAWTYLKTRAPRGAELPWRPNVEARAGLELHSGPLGWLEDVALIGTWNHRGSFFHDPANLVRMPSRQWIGGGVRVDLPRGLDVLFTARDLADEGGQDFLGQPLPGRRYALTLRYEMEL
ncbi:MAG: TonB-dependent receptor [Polyangiales bacterium]